jgi:rubrerythrin
MNVFSASDIVEFAVRIEENGANFYKYAVQLLKDEEAKGIFSRLADEELNHKRTFEKIFAVIEKETPPESYTGEYAAYLHNYVDNNIIFNKAKIDTEVAAVKDTVSALDFAIRRELDSIAYYNEIKGIVPAAHHGPVDLIITEERKHFMILTGLKTKFSK